MEGKILFSRYKILNAVGKGSFSVVYKAIDLLKEFKYKDDSRCFVAIKVIDMLNPKLIVSDCKSKNAFSNAQNNPSNQLSAKDITIRKNQLLREIEISKNVHHPNIVECYDVFHEESNDHDIYYIIMEFFPHGSLLDYLRKTGKCLDEQKARYLFNQMVSAVSYLHSKNIIHRDIKFENFVIVNSEQIKLIDFGFSIQSTPNSINDSTEQDYEIVNRNDHMRGTFCGSLAYSSPEIILHSRYSYSIDIWSLGVVLFGMIFGTFPFQGQGEVLKNEILTSSTYFPKPISNELKNLINGMLKKNPKHRLTIEQVNNHEWTSMFNSQSGKICEIFSNICINNNSSINSNSSNNFTDVNVNDSFKNHKMNKSISDYKSSLDLSNNIFINPDQKMQFLNNNDCMNNYYNSSVSKQQLPQFISGHQPQNILSNDDPDSLCQSEFDLSLSIQKSQRNSVSALSLNPFLILDKPEVKRYGSNIPKKIISHNAHNFDIGNKRSATSTNDKNYHQENFLMNNNDENKIKSTEKKNVFLTSNKLTQISSISNETSKLPSISSNQFEKTPESKNQKISSSKSVTSMKQTNSFIDDVNNDTPFVGHQNIQTPSLYGEKGKENVKKSRFINTSISLTFK